MNDWLMVVEYGRRIASGSRIANPAGSAGSAGSVADAAGGVLAVVVLVLYAVWLIGGGMV